VAGAVTVEAWDRAEVEVEAESEGGAPSVEQYGDRIVVQAPQTGGAHGFVGFLDRMLTFGVGLEAEITVRAPRDALVTVNTVSAEVTIRGFRRGARVRTVSGEVEVEATSGQLDLTTVSGEVTLKELRGELFARTVSGEVSVERGSLRSWDVKSASGSLEVEAALEGPGPYRFRTMSGNLELQVPDGASFELVARTMSGSVRCELPHTVLESSRRHWRARIGRGGPTVEFQSASGGARVRGGASVGPAAPETVTAAPTWPEEPEDPRLAVLRAVERGELSVEEGLARLEELDRAEGGPGAAGGPDRPASDEASAAPAEEDGAPTEERRRERDAGPGVTDEPS
jgi:hypothetical protein